MGRSRTNFLASLTAVLGFATPSLANVGITSVTAGDPLGQPPASPERVLRVGIDIQANEKVSTKSDDRAHLVFLDGTALTVGPNSTVMIDRYVYDPDRKAGELSLSTAKGVFRLVGGTISKTNDIKVTTPSATIGIRGGIATVEVADGGATKATFLYGDKLTVNAAGKTEVATRNGSQIETAAGRPPTPAAVVPPNGMAPMTAFERAPIPAPATIQQATAATFPITTLTTAISPTTTPTIAPTTTTTVLSTTQIDSALDSSDLSKTNSGLSRQRLSQEARFHHHNRGHIFVAAGGRGDGKGGPSITAGGPTRLAAPALNNVLRQVTVATRQVTNNSAKVSANQNVQSNSGKRK